ncbi:hypothetical protein C0Q70_00601 [Pomacea canaliculata]|uniref:Innexin n=1 Tax=Pomacea canaliculata TaxID=400727 RepID=A0A2T7PX68_POMCA|nr:hypothetical protein C0Q70_00601 [Pomacea canaliculata]
MTRKSRAQRNDREPTESLDLILLTTTQVSSQRVEKAFTSSRDVGQKRSSGHHLVTVAHHVHCAGYSWSRAKGINIVGEPIECLCPPQQSAAQCNYTKAWCRISSLMFIDYDTEIPHDPTQRQSASRQKMDGYPMVPVVLILLAFCLQFPSFLWQECSDGLSKRMRVGNVIGDTRLDEGIANIIINRQSLKRVEQGRSRRALSAVCLRVLSACGLFMFGKRFGTYETGLLMLTKLVTVCLLGGAFVVLASFMQTDVTWGWNLLYDRLTWRIWTAHGNEFFPAEVLCEVKVRQMQNESPQISAQTFPEEPFGVEASFGRSRYVDEFAEEFLNSDVLLELPNTVIAERGAQRPTFRKTAGCVVFYYAESHTAPTSHSWMGEEQVEMITEWPVFSDHQRKAASPFRQSSADSVSWDNGIIGTHENVSKVTKNVETSQHASAGKNILVNVPMKLTGQKSSEGKEFLQEESIQLKKRLDKGERTAGLMAALGSVEEWLHHSEDAVNYFTEAVKMEPESDFLQRTAPGTLYKDSWPSLFIAPSGINSGLHIDAFASNFWMALFQGKKNVVNPDMVNHPLLSLVHPVECILNAGEILFVPGGSPHYVENLETTLAISGNFVDLSNWRRALSELEVNGLTDPRAADLAWQFRQPTFVSNMDSCISDLPWLSFKTWPPQPSDISKMDISEQNFDFLHQKGS